MEATCSLTISITSSSFHQTCFIVHRLFLLYSKTTQNKSFFFNVYKIYILNIFFTTLYYTLFIIFFFNFESVRVHNILICNNWVKWLRVQIPWPTVLCQGWQHREVPMRRWQRTAALWMWECGNTSVGVYKEQLYLLYSTKQIQDILVSVRISSDAVPQNVVCNYR